MDSPSVSLSLGFDLQAELGKMRQELREAVQRFGRPITPFVYDRTHNLVTPASNTNPVVIEVGGPPQGKYWDVLNLSISGDTPTTTVNGRADIYVRGDSSLVSNQLTFGQIGTIGWRDQATSLPLTAFYGRRQLRVRNPQKLFVVLSGFSTTTEYIVNAEIEMYDDAPYVVTI